MVKKSSFKVSSKTGQSTKQVFCGSNTPGLGAFFTFLTQLNENTEQAGVHFGRPRDKSEPFFACSSDTGIEGIGWIELPMKFLDNGLSLVQMTDVVFRRKLGSSSREPLEHKRLYPFHISALAIHVDIVKHVAQVVSVGQVQHQALGEFIGEIFDPVRIVAE